ncbi:prolipoprotein diacylglyceryl transferase [Actinopolymorpha singaporensis]|uniref:Phosphatidylglycerol--prolipoprotein diacylglyceryl transferase n=1 Tax=Actinopolymorpha singaporensis TaxID=117157 RepID=A0A1H1X021_9ACTN|nr:prolipoprotein diacylglyceryl transferase [Actinopolymorpha singaporensis]SDT02441.1 prolipoprotein diacylglyceryl transferase [Actinopolymorpha singaporensis]
MQILASIPSPSQGVWHLGPLPLRAYAICIILGVVVAVWLGNRRWIERGGRPGTVADVAVWAVPFGLVGARLYHVITDYQLYFGPGREPMRAFAVWEGGLGIWGGVAFGALGAWIACRRRGIPLPAMADALAPGIVLAQAIGRWGNWFNQELFGAPTTAPWGLRIDPAHRPIGYEQYATFQPTFLFESIWDVGTALLVIWADRRFRLGHGRAFALYVMCYTLGRGWIEYLRVDPVNHILGLRLNVWTSVLVFLLAMLYFVLSATLRPGRERVVEPTAPTAPGDEVSATADTVGRGGVTSAQSTTGTGSPSASRSAAGRRASAEDELPTADQGTGTRRGTTDRGRAAGDPRQDPAHPRGFGDPDEPRQADDSGISAGPGTEHGSGDRAAPGGPGDLEDPASVAEGHLVVDRDRLVEQSTQIEEGARPSQTRPRGGETAHRQTSGRQETPEEEARSRPDHPAEAEGRHPAEDRGVYADERYPGDDRYATEEKYLADQRNRANEPDQDPRRRGAGRRQVSEERTRSTENPPEGSQ